MSDDLQVLQGTLDVLVLKTLSQGPMHGYAIARWLREAGGDELRGEDRALYVSLHRMEERGWIEAEWGVSEKNRRAKYYQLTEAGRAARVERAARARRRRRMTRPRRRRVEGTEA